MDTKTLFELLGYHEAKYWRSWLQITLAIIVVLFFLSIPESTPLPYQISIHHSHQPDSQKYAGDPTYGLLKYQKPPGVKLVGMVFYGRREFTEILDCYIKRNLVSAGGLLDEVVWIVRTDIKSDIDWVDETVANEPLYRKFDARGRHFQFGDAWSVCENGTLYLKLDDDVVFFEDHTIAAMVQRKLEHPEYLTISANGVNQPAFSWVHYHLSTFHPYSPELHPPEPADRSTSWRPSKLPQWTGPSGFKIKNDSPAPYLGHRWLPMDPNTTDIDDTVIAEQAIYHADGVGDHQYLHSWTAAAQLHYSFLTNLELGRLHRYKYDLWDYHYTRLSINFILVNGSDIVAHKQGSYFEDDEPRLTMHLTKELKRHAVMDGRGLAVHFNFGPQAHRNMHGTKGGALQDTDLLWRYKQFAEQNVCGRPRSKPFYPVKPVEKDHSW